MVTSLLNPLCFCCDKHTPFSGKFPRVGRGMPAILEKALGSAEGRASTQEKRLPRPSPRTAKRNGAEEYTPCVKGKTYRSSLTLSSLFGSPFSPLTRRISPYYLRSSFRAGRSRENRTRRFTASSFSTAARAGKKQVQGGFKREF
jgi:hypothetical protein